MNNWLALSFLFYIGSIIGWVIELFYRNLISHSGPKGIVLINPGFCKGPYLPIYGIGVVVMFTVCYALEGCNRLAVILIIAVTMTLIEFIGGVILLKVMNMRLWDYRDMKGNILGVICPQFSLIWGLLGAAYYLFVHPYIYEALVWLSNNLAFSFFIGLFYGVFIIDLTVSIKDAVIIKNYGDENKVIIKLEELKAHIQDMRAQMEQKTRFFNQIMVDNKPLKHLLNEIENAKEDRKLAFRKIVEDIKERRGENPTGKD